MFHIDAQAEQIACEAYAVLREADSFSVDLLRTRLTTRRGAPDKRTTGRHRVAFVRPNKLAWVNDDEFGMHIYCDGSEVVAYLPQARAYVVAEAPPQIDLTKVKTPSVLYTSLEPESGNELILAAAMQTTKPLDSGIWRGPEFVRSDRYRLDYIDVVALSGGGLCHHLRLTLATEVKFSGDPEEAGVPIEVVNDFFLSAEAPRRLLHAQHTEDQVYQAAGQRIPHLLEMRSIWTYECDWTVNQPVDESLFRFELPQGAVRATNLFRATQIGLSRQS